MIEAIDMWRQRVQTHKEQFPDAYALKVAAWKAGARKCETVYARNAAGEEYGKPRDEISVPIADVQSVFAHHRQWMRIIESRKGKS